MAPFKAVLRVIRVNRTGIVPAELFESVLKESTMNIRRAFALPILFLLLTVSSVAVFGQSDRQTVVTIPFDFVVGDKSMSAGQYIFERNKRESDTVWTITRKDAGVSRRAFLTIPTQSLDPAERTRLVFHRYENQYFLSAFTIAGSNTGRELRMSDREKNLGDKLLAQREDVILTSGRGK